MKKIIKQADGLINSYICGFIWHHELMSELLKLAGKNNMSWAEFCADVLTLCDKQGSDI